MSSASQQNSELSVSVHQLGLDLLARLSRVLTPSWTTLSCVIVWRSDLTPLRVGLNIKHVTEVVTKEGKFVPRAENRSKRPPNLSSNSWDAGAGNKSNGAHGSGGAQSSINRKQELVEKMKKLQESKKSEPKL